VKYENAFKVSIFHKNALKYHKCTLRTLRIIVKYFCIIIKQWLLAREFSEFEYSPKNIHFWRVLALAKMAFFGNLQDSPDSPTFAKQFWDTRQTRIRQK
jgi:hypothetical protein